MSDATLSCQARTGSRRIAEIEVLRGIAVLCVVAQHWDNLLPHTTPVLASILSMLHGWFGVDLFFAISGFVIARQLLPTLSQARSGVLFWRETRQFWIRRAFRLLPSAWLWLLIMVVASVGFNRTGLFGSLHANLAALAAGMLDYANFRFADSFGRYEYGASFVYWSLSLEEQFYLLLPILVLLFRSRLPWVLGLATLIQLMLWRHTPLLMVVRTDALMLGVLLALAERHTRYAALQPLCLGRYAVMRWSVLAALFACMWLLSSEAWAWFRFHLGMIALCGATLVWLASYDAGYIVRQPWIKRILLYVGARSYAIYLIHVPAMFACRELLARVWPHADPASWAVALSLSAMMLAVLLICSELNYRWVEMPLRAYGARLGRAPGKTEGAYPARPLAVRPSPDL